MNNSITLTYEGIGHVVVNDTPSSNVNTTPFRYEWTDQSGNVQSVEHNWPTPDAS